MAPIKHNIKKLYVFSALKMALFPMAIITLYWKDQIGLSLSQILFLQGMFSLATLLMEYPSGYLSDRWGYRFSLNLASVIGICGWIAYSLATTFLGVLGAEILLGISFAFISGSDTALLYETLRAEGREEDYAFFDGRMNGFAQAGEALGALFAGVLYQTAPLLPFIVQIGVWCCASLITLRLQETPTDETCLVTSHIQEAWQTVRYALQQNLHLRHTLLVTTLLGIASFYPVWLIQPYMQQTGVPLPWFGPIWAGANLTVAIFSTFSHRLRFQWGDRGALFLFFLLIISGYLGLGLYGGVWGFLFYYLLTAMRGLQGPLMRQHIQAAGSRRNRASLLSLKSFLFRLLFVLTGPGIGWLADNFGLQSTFLGLAFAFTTLLIPSMFLFLRTLSVKKL